MSCGAVAGGVEGGDGGVDEVREAGDGGGGEHFAQGQGGAEFGVDAGGDAGGGQGVPAEAEEMVVCGECGVVGESEDFVEQPPECFFRIGLEFLSASQCPGEVGCG